MCLTILEHYALKGSSEKKDKNLKENYRPANLLPYIAKAFVWFIFKHISNFVSLSSRNISALQKGYNTEHFLLFVLEKRNAAVNRGTCFGTLLTNSLYAFEWLSQEPLFAKLHAHFLSLVALKRVPFSKYSFVNFFIQKETNFASYANDSMSYLTSENLDDVISY